MISALAITTITFRPTYDSAKCAVKKLGSEETLAEKDRPILAETNIYINVELPIV